MAQLDVASFLPALKLLYPKGLAEILYPKCPLMGWMPKSTDFYGEAAVITPMYGGTRGSTTFTNAINDQGVVSLSRFLVTRVKDYAPASIEAEALMASANDKGAIAKALDTQIKGALYEFGRSAAFQIYSDGTGRRGRVSGFVAGQDFFTLANVEDVVRFEVGMDLQASVGVTVPAPTDPFVRITAINRRTGLITTDAALGIETVIIGFADTWGVFRSGDGGNCATGLNGWVPTNDPGVGGVPPNLFGLNRTIDPLRLAGVRIAGGGGVMEETVFDAVAEAHINGAQPDTLFINSRRFAELQKSMYSKTWVTVNTDIPGIGYKALQFPTDYGEIAVISDPNCPTAEGYLLQRDSWKLHSLGEFPHFATDDGLKYRRLATADAIEFRIRGFWNVECDKPGMNAVITW